MAYEIALIAVAAFVLSVFLTSRMRSLALTKGILDIPNERSSHSVPVARGGGVAIVLATTGALSLLRVVGLVPLDLFLAVVGGGSLVAFVGFMDDRRRLSARVRLAVHFAAALWGIASLGGLPPLHLAEQVDWTGWIGYSLGSLAIVWVLNLFNFMDGIDGIAASEAIFMAWGGAFLTLMVGASAAVPVLALVFGAACCGFLIWNWPPAKIFMGDVGSGYLGYMLAVLAIAASREASVSLVAWLILGGAFFVDATLTLSRRIFRGERPAEAHRTHAYQWLSRRWASHRKVTILILVINLFWLLPCAVLAARREDLAWWILLVAFVPIAIGALLVGAGRRELA